jgi:hypothetical protein
VPPLQLSESLPHLLPQAPQLSLSVARLLQPPLQQVWSAPHTWPHPPQLAASFWVATQLPLQQACPLPQLLSLVQTQRPAWQLKLFGQAWLQPPQFLASLF